MGTWDPLCRPVAHRSQDGMTEMWEGEVQPDHSGGPGPSPPKMAGQLGIGLNVSRIVFFWGLWVERTFLAPARWPKSPVLSPQEMSMMGHP